jgi:hypothetical protein
MMSLSDRQQKTFINFPLLESTKLPKQFLEQLGVVESKTVREFVDIEHIGGEPLGPHPDLEIGVSRVEFKKNKPDPKQHA